METFGTVTLKKNEERRLQAGHQWIFSNEIANVTAPPSPGAIMELRSSTGLPLGVGFYNKHSLIAFRHLSRSQVDSLPDLVKRRVRSAEDLRSRLGYGSVYRLIHGEADYLPGLIVDRYEDLFVISSYAAGADLLIPDLVDVLKDLFKPEGIVEISDSPWRGLEGLSPVHRVHHGQSSRRQVRIDDLSFVIDPEGGQKTGMFLDQRDTRRFVGSIASGLRVLDLCCNDGGFSMYAAQGGALSVDAVDISGRSLDLARENAALNGLHSIQFIESDVFEFLQSRLESKTHYDLVIADPPAFVKSRKALVTGLKGYQRLNELCIRAVKTGGLLVTCSCSQHVSEESFLEMVNKSARRTDSRFQALKISGAAMDHPVLPAMPETRYLTCVAARITR